MSKWKVGERSWIGVLSFTFDLDPSEVATKSQPIEINIQGVASSYGLRSSSETQVVVDPDATKSEPKYVDPDASTDSGLLTLNSTWTLTLTMLAIKRTMI